MGRENWEREREWVTYRRRSSALPPSHSRRPSCCSLRRSKEAKQAIAGATHLLLLLLLQGITPSPNHPTSATAKRKQVEKMAAICLSGFKREERGRGWLQQAQPTVKLGFFLTNQVPLCPSYPDYKQTVPGTARPQHVEVAVVMSLGALAAWSTRRQRDVRQKRQNCLGRHCSRLISCETHFHLKLWGSVTALSSQTVPCSPSAQVRSSPGHVKAIQGKKQCHWSPQLFQPQR